MISIKKGNILDCEEDIICHQVNVQGVMGGGLARQLADRYPDLEKNYHNFCKENDFDYENLKNRTYYEIVNNDCKTIANIFSQRPNFYTDYNSLMNCLISVEYRARERNQSVAIPYKIGCRNCKWRLE